MNGSTLIQLFKSLDKADRRQLRKFVNSPFFNQREDVTKLFEYIDKNIEAGAPKLMKEKAYAAVYPKEKFDVDKFYYPMSFLTQIILKYLAINELEKQPPQYNRLLNQALKHRGAEKIYEKTLSDARTQLENQPLRNATYLHNSFLIRFEEFDMGPRLHRDHNFELQDMVNDFHFYCIAEVLRIGYGLLSHKSVSKKDYYQPLLKAVLNIAENHLDIPVVATQYYAFQTMEEVGQINSGLIIENTEGGYFKKLKKELTENNHFFPQSETRDLLMVAINYAILKQNRGELGYVREALDLYAWGIDNKALLDNSFLSPYTFKNASMLALKIRDYDWAEKFLNDYKIYLPEKERENLYKYNMAIFHFRKEDFSKAMDLLQEVNLKETLFNLDARRLLARIYYDSKEFDALSSFIESSKIYLFRQKDIGYQKEAYTNFFRIIEKMLKMDLKLANNRQSIKEEVEQIKVLAEKEWILSKLT
jgi:hypothetical protein